MQGRPRTREGLSLLENDGVGKGVCILTDLGLKSWNVNNRINNFDRRETTGWHTRERIVVV